MKAKFGLWVWKHWEKTEARRSICDTLEWRGMYVWEIGKNKMNKMNEDSLRIWENYKENMQPRRRKRRGLRVWKEEVRRRWMVQFDLLVKFEQGFFFFKKAIDNLAGCMWWHVWIPLGHYPRGTAYDMTICDSLKKSKFIGKWSNINVFLVIY